MSDRIALMRDGRLLAIGGPRDLYEAPSGEYAARFIGDMNVLDAVAEAADVARIDGVSMRVPAGLELGRQVRFGLRPERVVLDATASELATRPATVEEAVYLGETTKYRLRTRTGAELLAVQSNTRGTRHFNVGDDVIVGWDPADLRVLADRA
jgi:ABC-type Fe3+/spermidine/putrescine transport system ATPase subunit